MKRILICGLGRSGTSWALKTFDHHPYVFASHEPELVLDPDIRAKLESDDPADARLYTKALYACRGLRAMRKRPIRKKPYQSIPSYTLRSAYILGLAAIGRAGFGMDRVVNTIPVPDLANLDDVAHVVKTVSLQYNLAKIASSCPDVRIVYIIRHPCGQVHSHLKGIENRKMNNLYLPRKIEMQRLFGFDEDALKRDHFSNIEIASYRWAVYCDINYRMSGEHSNVRLVRYEDICDDPIARFKELFAWVDLSWNSDVEDFLMQSLNSKTDSDSYHGLIRNPSIAAAKWREMMTEEELGTIRRICRRSAAAELFPDLQIRR